MQNRSREAVESLTGSMMEPEYELSDEQWLLIADLFPESPVGPQGGRPTVPARACVEGILWILRSGARWKDMPRHFPSATTCWRRHRAWTESGIWQRAWGRLLRSLDRAGQVDHRESFADASFSPAKKGVRRSERPSEARVPRSSFSRTLTGFPWASILQVPVPMSRL